ncbi:MAG: Lrp/AsnC family transcriptional regulator [Roseibium album]|uniref:Lrp/AsnC family transcriptional regulator n=1 Tax=Roseibium album TaxID=311410 RepID=UPI0032EE378F
MSDDHSDLSSVDRTILSIMQRDSNSRMESIAEEAGASIATVQRRLRHFRQANIIQREIAVVDPETVGQGMTFLILVELERERIDILDTFRRKVTSEQQVQQCYYITGDADFALIALAKDMNEYQKLIQRLFFDDTNVKRFRTSVVMDRTKVGLNVPV